MLNHYYATAILNAIFKTNQAPAGDNGTVTFSGTGRYVGLFKTMPSDNGADYVEPSKPEGAEYSEEYSRINVTNAGSYGNRMMGQANFVEVSFTSSTVSVARKVKTTISGTPTAQAAQNELKYKIPVTLVGGGTETVEVTVAKNDSTGSKNATGTIDTTVMKAYSFDEVYNQDNITFPKCINYDWAPVGSEILGFGVFDAASGGNLIYWDELDTPMAITRGTIPIFDIENLLKVKITH